LVRCKNWQTCEKTIIMKLVPVDEIPKSVDIKDVALDDLAEIYKICNKMENVCEAENGIGLSAVQVGIPLKLFVVKADDGSKFDNKGEYGYFLNCEYEPQQESGQIISIEGCLSLRSDSGELRHFQVMRYTDILISGYKLNKDMKLEEVMDFQIGVSEQAVVFQHEIEHHSGILISDKGQEIFLWR